MNAICNVLMLAIAYAIIMALLTGCAEPQSARYTPPYMLRQFVPHDDILDAPARFQELFPHKPLVNPDNWT